MIRGLMGKGGTMGLNTFFYFCQIKLKHWQAPTHMEIKGGGRGNILRFEQLVSTFSKLSFNAGRGGLSYTCIRKHFRWLWVSWDHGRRIFEQIITGTCEEWYCIKKEEFGLWLIIKIFKFFILVANSILLSVCWRDLNKSYKLKEDNFANPLFGLLKVSRLKFSILLCGFTIFLL